ncbi:MAG TPA: metalloregulator ArsR/SmtB family transcription factor [Acidimicrobiales bacterium]|nr:metalloregulator ArsR/SmtB family transcription factor [Acidimicrobiales bacterium]
MDDLQRRIKALSSPVRREILWRLWDAELPAGAIAAAFEVTPPTISSHLRVLKEAGLVHERRAGTHRFYRVDREALRALQPLLELGDRRWEPADDLPERAATTTAMGLAVIVSTTVDVAAAEAFRALTDPNLFGRWLGVPVTLEGGVFAATMEWGTTVRGRYEHLVEPGFIHFAWDVADGGAPVPGGELPAYVHIADLPRRRAQVEARQLVATSEQAAFMDAAWGVVLGRLHDGVAEAMRGGAAPRRRRRPKRRS